MFDRIMLTSSKENSYDISAEILDADLAKKGISKSDNPEYYKTTKYLFGVVENFLTGQFGLHIPARYFPDLNSKYKKNLQIKSPFWVDETLISGPAHFRIGSFGPFGFGFGAVEPNKNRKILEGCFDQDIVTKARSAGRVYTSYVQDKAQKLINDIISNPNNARSILSSINPYAFEELVAELLVDKGFDVILTPKSGDEGKDIIAVTIHEGSPVVMLVECKRRPIDKTLGPVEVRALVGQFYMDRLTNNMVSLASLVTTSGSIGPSALQMEQRCTQLSIKNFNELTKWISSYGKIQNNLWVPDPLSEFL